MVGQIIIWWLVIQALGLIGLPLTTFLFRQLADRGYAFAKPLGLLLTGYLAWLLAMLGLASWGAGLLVACGLAVGLLGLAANARQQGGRRALLDLAPYAAQLRAQWRLILGYELLFGAALVFGALLRAHDQGYLGPNPWGTERPMDFALFNAIRRSETFPPHDPWLSGYSINYYYFGYLLMAAVALLSGLDPAVAYNLALALVFALAALGVAGVVANLMLLTEDLRRKTGDKERGRQGEGETGAGVMEEGEQAEGGRRPWSSLVFGPPSFVLRPIFVLLGVVLVLLAGNQGGAVQVITGTPSALALSGTDLARAIGNGLGPRETLTLRDPFQEWGAPELTYEIAPTDTLANFNWWNPSRALWDGARQPGDPTKFYAITEFPFFSFWLGDMHPHVMALPFGLLALALALQTALRPAAPMWGTTRRSLLELALVGVVLGSLYAINSWDFPTYLLMFLGALLLLYARLGVDHSKLKTQHSTSTIQPSAFSLQPLRIWWGHYLQQALLVVVASLVMFAPFHLTFRSLVGGLPPLIDLPLLATITRTIGFFNWNKTPLHTFVIIFGLFLLPLTVFVFAQGRALRRAAAAQAEARGEAPALRPEALRFVQQGAPALPLLMFLPWAVPGALAVGLLAGFPLLFLLPLGLYAALLALRATEQPARGFALGAFALGAFVCLGTELIYIRDTFEGAAARMNTIFKFYYQVWLIWGTLAGYALWWLLGAGDGGRGTGDTRHETRDTRHETRDTRHETRDTRHETGGGGADRWSVVGGRWSVVGGLSSFVLVGVFLLLLGGALLYPWLTAGKAFREAPLAGLAGKTPRQQTPAGEAAIAWLRANAPSSAVVLEAVGGSYDDNNSGLGFGGVSASTGLATVLGWPGHEMQWRGGDGATLAQIGPREEDVRTIYSTTDLAQARDLLAQYGVDYIYIGAAEAAKYPPEGLAKFSQLGAPVFQQDEITIYKVE